MIEKLKELWKWYRPIFMTRSKLFSLLVSSGVERDKINDKFTWAEIRPVISSLEELKKNTWDKDRVEWIQKYLKDNFEVEDDNDWFEEWKKKYEAEEIHDLEMENLKLKQELSQTYEKIRKLEKLLDQSLYELTQNIIWVREVENSMNIHINKLKNEKKECGL